MFLTPNIFDGLEKPYTPLEPSISFKISILLDFIISSLILKYITNNL